MVGGEFYLKPANDAMCGNEYKEEDKMNEIRTTNRSGKSKRLE